MDGFKAQSDRIDPDLFVAVIKETPLKIGSIGQPAPINNSKYSSNEVTYVR